MNLNPNKMEQETLLDYLKREIPVAYQKIMNKEDPSKYLKRVINKFPSEIREKLRKKDPGLFIDEDLHDLEDLIANSPEIRRDIQCYQELSQLHSEERVKKALLTNLVREAHKKLSPEDQTRYSETRLCIYLPKINLGVITVKAPLYEGEKPEFELSTQHLAIIGDHVEEIAKVMAREVLKGLSTKHASPREVEKEWKKIVKKNEPKHRRKKKRV